MMGKSCLEKLGSGAGKSNWEVPGVRLEMRMGTPRASSGVAVETVAWGHRHSQLGRSSLTTNAAKTPIPLFILS